MGTGRCGTTTFVRACRHMTNYTAGHETRWRLVGPDRLRYPESHIEADNRLSWMLGRLDIAYGDRAFYVHLIRDREETARSFAVRFHRRRSIVRAYADAILVARRHEPDVCRDYWDTVNANIALFLRDKANTLTMHLESPVSAFLEFWERIGATGDFDNAVAEWTTTHNPTPTGSLARRCVGLARRRIARLLRRPLG